MSKEYDLIVIGTGPAASKMPVTVASAGWQVAVIDSETYGGTCGIKGCNPKKTIVEIARGVDSARRAVDGGAEVKLSIDWSRLIEFKRKFTEPVPRKRVEDYAEAGIDMYHGRASFDGPDRIRVGDDLLIGKHICIATGAKPRALGIPGEEHVSTSEDFLEMENLPGRVLFIGGGYISFEFSHVAAIAGAKVTILQRSDRPLKKFDPDLVERLCDRSRDLGIDIQLNTEVDGVEKISDGFTVHGSRDGEKTTYQTDLVVHGAGRVPQIDDLGLEKGNVDFDKHGIIVDEYLRSVSNPKVYAAGDVVGSSPPLTPAARHEGGVAASNLLEPSSRKVYDYPIPSVAFTIPPLARIGLLESEAVEQGLEVEVCHHNISKWKTHRRVGDKHAACKILVDKSTDRIIGAHIFGHRADEQINLFTLAMRAGVTASELHKTIFAFPTSGYDAGWMVSTDWCREARELIPED